MNPAAELERELYLAPGGPAYRWMKRLGLTGEDGRSVLRRIVAMILLTWVPMCLLALWQGAALADTARGSFLLDFGTYARFFVALPMLVLADAIIGPRLRSAGLQFVRDDFVRPAQLPAFGAAVARLARRRDSKAAMLVIMAMAVFGAWQLTAESAIGVGHDSWQTLQFAPGDMHRFSLAALWNHFVAVPLVLYLLYRWLWRIAIWTVFLWNVSRLDLDLVPTHADRSGGLGFLEPAHNAFACLAFGMGSVLSAQAAFRIVYEGAPLTTFQGPVLIVLVLMLVLFLGPLLVFSPMLARARRAALFDYGSLVARHNRGFHRKWIEGAASANEPLLGNPDMGAMADLGGSFQFIDQMRATPFGLRAVMLLAAATLLPCLPLVLLAVPIAEIIDTLAKVVL